MIPMVVNHHLRLPFRASSSVLMLMLTVGCVAPLPSARPPPPDAAANHARSTTILSSAAAADLAERWGMRVESLRLSAQGHILDFRYRVLDPDKAAALTDSAQAAWLINEATGERHKVPKMPKMGTLRSTAVRPEAGRIYVILFANPGASIQSGDRVAVEIGAFRAEHLVVE